MLDISLPKLFVIVGLLAILAELYIGIQAGFDLVVIGSILVSSGMVGETFNSVTISLVSAIILSIIYLLFFRKVLRQKISKTSQQLNTDRLIGAVGKVSKAITPSKAGQVVIEDEVWRATSGVSLKKGEVVTVVRVHGVSIEVIKRIQTKSNSKRK